MKTTDSSLSFPRHCAIPLLSILCATAPPADAAELGAIAMRSSWPTLPLNLGTYTKGGTGIVTDTSAESTFSSHAAASFHTLAVAASAKGRNNGQSRMPWVGGRAYWFESMTISSPSVPNGTIGTADFTLFFEGGMSTGPSISGTNTYFAELEYRWSGGSDLSDGKPDISSGELTSRRSEVFSTHTTTTGPEFYLNQPRNHRMTFRFGVPFDFTIWISARGSAWDNAPSNSKVSLRMTGWNGFHNISIRDGAAVVDAVIGSQTGFNYGGPGTISFEQWASQFQLAADAMSGDANQNGVSNLLEYALGRDPMAPGGGEPIILGKAMEEGVEYPTMVFTRPVQGAMPGDIIYTPQRSTTLEPEGWSSNGLVVESEPVAGTQLETVTVRSPEPLGSLNGEWMRLKVEKQE